MEPKFAGTQLTKKNWVQSAETIFRIRELVPMRLFLETIEGNEAIVEATRPVVIAAVLKGPCVKGKFMERLKCLEVIDRIYKLTEDELLEGYKCTKTMRGFPYKHELMHGCVVSMVKYPRLLLEFAKENDVDMKDSLDILKPKMDSKVLDEFERLLRENGFL